MRRRSLLPAVLFCIALVPSMVSAQERFIGSISLVPYTFAPFGTAFCNGQLMAISENEALFALIGTTYGGDGQSTFALPDLRGRVAIGMGQGPGLARYQIGQEAGSENVTLTVSQMPAHNHTAIASTSPGNTVDPTSAYWAPGPRIYLYSSASNLTQMNGAAIGTAGGNQPHDNVKPYLTLNYVIWLFGIFPSQS